MKKGKKFLSLLLIFVLAFSISTVAFADDGESSAEPTRHTVVFDVPANSESEIEVANSARIWNQGTWGVSGNQTLYTQRFIIPDRYFAYEFSATGSNSTYNVALYYGTTISLASCSNTANGNWEKMDWIEPIQGAYHTFRIYNPSSSAISVTITYYSWV